MAAISQKVAPQDVLPLLARNVVMEGYHSRRSKHRKPTEFLTLLKRYLNQAYELHRLAGLKGIIRISKCRRARPLLAVLGYRLRRPCGPHTSVETADPDKAFLTIDSGFPLADLEETLRGGRPFTFSFTDTQLPVLFTPADWTDIDKDPQVGLVGALLKDPVLARLYWAMSRMDDQTRANLRRSPGIQKLLPLASVLDFYGSQIYIRSGRVMVPGGAAAEPGWQKLVGASPESPGKFVVRLLEKDEGWLAAYYDALARVNHAQQAYFTEPHRLRRFYEALRGDRIAPSPVRPVFRPDPELLLLVTRLQFDPNGQPHVPGNLEIWKEVLRRKADSRLTRRWATRADRWNKPEQLVEGMFGLSRSTSKDGPLQVYLALSEIDRNRSPEQRLSAATVRLLADKFSRFHAQYLVFSEFPSLDNNSIMRFMVTAQALDRISNRVLRANALGIFQADIGLWQILARQQEIPEGDINGSWQRVIYPFARITSSTQLFDGARASLSDLLRAAGAKPDLSQNEIVELLAGPNLTTAEGLRVKQALASRMRSVLNAQRLVSLDTLFQLGEGLNQLAAGKAMADSLIQLAGQLRAFEMPRPMFSNRERSEWASGLYNDRHTTLQMETDLAKIIRSPRSPKQLAEARGQLVPFLRDTLVGLNYAYYEPPGAQMLLNNPLFVRSHDFSGQMTMGGEQAWQTPRLFGRGWTASGGAHLAGSLADLPYVLAQVEQAFIVPQNVQSLIWEDLAPDLLTSAVVSRWWHVSRNEMHAVALYQRLGEELLTASMQNLKLRQEVLNILSNRLLPQRLGRVDEALRAGNGQEAISELAPSETFYLGAEFRERSPDQSTITRSGRELDALARSDPDAVSWKRLSRDFGVPHPALALTYNRELLNVKPFPTFLGYSSRLLAESWDSNNLYWARLADEMGYPPVMLNRLVPVLTRRMVANIFATDLDDWPAVLRALRETGKEFREGKIPSFPKTAAASGLQPDKF